ncbi:MAG: alpha/beta fold hydrolase [Chloroflexi bacterium]|nr:alpha/beta fold hydrolase [Chloroflexota bacterium]
MPQLPAEFIELPGIRLAYCQHGSGPDLLLLHGNSESKRIFSSYQREHFAAFRTFALDTRGHGQSRSKDAILTFDQISDDVIAFCRAKGIERACVIGYSDGGNTALMLAHKDPVRFPRLVAISPNYLVSGTTDGTLRDIRRIHARMKVLKRVGLPVQKHLLRFDLMLRDMGISEEALQGIRADLLILYAERDMIKEDHLQRLAGLVPGARLQKIMGCTHMSIYRHPEALRAMRDFLG